MKIKLKVGKVYFTDDLEEVLLCKYIDGKGKQSCLVENSRGGVHFYNRNGTFLPSGKPFERDITIEYSEYPADILEETIRRKHAHDEN